MVNLSIGKGTRKMSYILASAGEMALKRIFEAKIEPLLPIRYGFGIAYVIRRLGLNSQTCEAWYQGCI